MPFVVFAAPRLSENAFGMVVAAATLPDVRLAVITHDGAEGLQHLQARVAHWQVENILDVEQLVGAGEGLSRLHGTIDRFFGAYEQLQGPLAEARARLGVEGMSAEAATNFRDKAQMKSLLRRAGLPCARHCLARTTAEAIAFASANGFPLVVKPPAGAGAIATFRVDNLAALQGALQQTPPTAKTPVLLEEFESFPVHQAPPARGASREEEDLSLHAAEQRHIEWVLRRMGGNKRQAARALGLSRSTLDRKLAEAGKE